MAIDFPTSPTAEQVHNVSPGVSFVFRGGVWVPAPMKTALPKNYIVNPSMQITQQNGTNPSGNVASGGYYAADEWLHRWGVSGSALQSIWLNVIGGYGYNTVYLRANTAKASLGAAEYVLLTHGIEGNRVADLQWGTPQAKQLVLRFSNVISVEVPKGTYCFRISNSDESRSYIGSYTIAADNDWREYTAVIPGDTSGTWVMGNGCGLRLEFTIAIGTNFHGVPGWQNGNFYALPGQANGVAVPPGDFHIGQVGLYADPYKTGVAPRFVLPDYAQELRRCQRYWYKLFSLRGGATTSASYISETGGSKHPAPMRVSPALSLIGTVSTWDGGGGGQMTSIGSTGNELVAGGNVYTTAGHIAGRHGVQYYSTENDYIAVSARL
jgi:hypothetical protein